jgi:hypothetical protein
VIFLSRFYLLATEIMALLENKWESHFLHLPKSTVGNASLLVQAIGKLIATNQILYAYANIHSIGIADITGFMDQMTKI